LFSAVPLQQDRVPWGVAPGALRRKSAPAGVMVLGVRVGVEPAIIRTRERTRWLQLRGIGRSSESRALSDPADCTAQPTPFGSRHIRYNGLVPSKMARRVADGRIELANNGRFELKRAVAVPASSINHHAGRPWPPKRRGPANAARETFRRPVHLDDAVVGGSDRFAKRVPCREPGEQRSGRRPGQKA